MTVPLFIHASLWPFLLALLVPLWLHLRRRRNARTQVLPTFALLQKALGQQTPVLRWQQILLLVSRLLTLLFLILAFLQPTVPAALAPVSGGRRVVVIALDVSLSMGAARGGVTALRRAQGQAMALLDDLRRGDAANVILFGATARPVLPKPSRDFGALRQAVRAAVPTFERGSPSAAIALAESELAEATAGTRELLVASDFQKSNWTADAFAELPADVRLVLLDAGENPPDNAAITALKLPDIAPIPGEPAPITAEIWNGSASARDLTVSLDAARDDGGVSNLPQIPPQTVTVPPFASANLTFSVSFSDAARYRVTARLPHDSLPADDSRYLIADLQNRLNVLLLTDSRFNPADGATYLRQALNPAPQTPGGFRVLSRRPSELTANDLRASEVVVCSEIEAFPPERIALLGHYLTDGGAVLFFLANSQSAAQAVALSKQIPDGKKASFQPETYLDIRGQGRGFVALNPPKTENPLLRLFADPAVADLTKIRFTRYFLTAPPDPAAAILLTFEDGTPALARCEFGRGTLLLANFSASPLAGDLAKQTLFPPLVHELTQGIAGRNGERTELLCGGSFALAREDAALAETLAATGPNGEPDALIRDKTGGAIVSNLARPGIHHVTAGGRTVAAFAVNFAPEESDLRRADLRELQAKRGVGAANLVGRNGQTLDSLRYNISLWPYCLVLAIVFLLAELWLLAQNSLP